MQVFPTNPYTIGPFSSDLLLQVTVSPKVVWVGARTKFPHSEKGRVRKAELRYVQITLFLRRVKYVSILHPCALDIQLYVFDNINIALYK